MSNVKEVCIHFKIPVYPDTNSEDRLESFKKLREFCGLCNWPFCGLQMIFILLWEVADIGKVKGGPHCMEVHIIGTEAIGWSSLNELIRNIKNCGGIIHQAKARDLLSEQACDDGWIKLEEIKENE